MYYKDSDWSVTQGYYATEKIIANKLKNDSLGLTVLK